MFTVKEKAFWSCKLQDYADNSHFLKRYNNTMKSAGVTFTQDDSSLTAQCFSYCSKNKIAKLRAATATCHPPSFTCPRVSELIDQASYYG